MKCLILGASGLVGWNLLQKAKALGHETMGTCRSHPLEGLLPLSMDNQDGVLELVRRFRPDAVFYCCGWSWVDGCEGDSSRAMRENVDEPARLARKMVELGSSFVYFSTSYVFDGTSGPYTEEAETCPLSVYGASKLQGEKAIMEATQGRCLIGRTMGVYGEEPQQKNFVYQVRLALASGKKFRVPNDQWGNATYAGDMAAMALELAGQKQTGIWNLAGPDPNICRSDLAYLIARTYSLVEELIEPVPTTVLGQAAPRPRHAGLSIDKVKRATGIVPQAWVKIP